LYWVAAHCNIVHALEIQFPAGVAAAYGNGDLIKIVSELCGVEILAQEPDGEVCTETERGREGSLSTSTLRRASSLPCLVDVEGDAAQVVLATVEYGVTLMMMPKAVVVD
jgi:hypothetical protein